MQRATLLVAVAAVCVTYSGAFGSSPSSKLHPYKSNYHRLWRVQGGSSDTNNEESNLPSAADLTRNISFPDVDGLSPHSTDVATILSALRVSDKVGLSTREARERLLHYGSNSLSVAEKRSLLASILEQFEDRLVQILLGVAVLSAVLSVFEKEDGAFVEPIVILTILVLNAVVGVWQTRSAEGAVEALKKLQPETACVLRDSNWIQALPSEELVPGDIIYLRVGDKVPADARLLTLKTTSFSTDEGSLTGESSTVGKFVDIIESPEDQHTPIQLKFNMVFSGTVVTNGGAFAVVTATGTKTEIGRIEQGVLEAKSEATKTPLALKLDEFAHQLTLIIGGICLAVWACSYPKFYSPVFGSFWRGALYYAKVAVALGVAAIPEGLPAVITLCLSLGTRRMAQRNVIVRKLPSVETLGCTSVICTDKTGTLTTNQMTVLSLVTFEEDSNLDEPFLIEHNVDGYSYHPEGTVHGVDDRMMNMDGMANLASVCALCNEAQLIFTDGKFDRVGEPTEAALKVLVEKLGAPGVIKSADPQRMCRQCNDHWYSNWRTLATLEFSRTRKSMSVLCKHTDSGKTILFVKGAAEVLVRRCSKMQLVDGRIVEMTPELRDRVIAKISEMARRPLRCLALGWKEGLGELDKINSEGEASASRLLQDSDNFLGIESGLTLVGMCGIRDPPRPEAAEAILQCGEAGVRVMMITGDSKETAIAIAKDVNIFKKDEDVEGKAFTGQEFFSLPEEKQRELLFATNMVFCRTEPKDKQNLVRMLQAGDEIVAMTGDGVNDAPALQQAAIGVAMGITGTEVSKQAADMILADDNFKTIVAAVEEGRCIYNNMQSFICFLISCNIGEIATIFFATLLGLPEPLTPLHLLWVNLVTDGPPATALGFNPPDPDSMSKPPRPKNEPILSKWLLTRYIVTGLYVGFATIGVYVWWYMAQDVKFRELINWGQCSVWDSFAPLPVEGLDIATNPCSIFSEGRVKPQSLSLSVLVCMEMLKALSAISLDNSLAKVQPWVNPWLLAGVSLPVSLHLLVLYCEPLNKVFGVTPLSWQEWKVVLGFSLPILLVDEVLKAIGRYINANKTSSPLALLAVKRAKSLQELKHSQKQGDD